MENVSKALIIAGSILIAILLIGAGIWTFNSNRGMKDKSLETGEITSGAMTSTSSQIREDLGIDTESVNSGSNEYNPIPEGDNSNVEIIRSGLVPEIYQGKWYIYNTKQFKFFAEFVNNGNKLTEQQETLVNQEGISKETITMTENTIVYLKNDLDLAGENWIPIGNAQAKFIGIFEGSNFTISNANVNVKNYAGIFGYANCIRNLIISDSIIEAKYGYAGGIAACAKQIENCKSIDNIIKGTTDIGGVVGYINKGIVQNSNNNSAVYYKLNDEIYNEYNYKAPQTGNKLDEYGIRIGGIVGTAYNSNIVRCINEGSVNNEKGRTGGIVGEVSNSTVRYCKNIGNIAGKDNVGGIVGITFTTSDINKSYNSGTVTGNAKNLGGICGSTGIGSHSYIQQCYNKGKIIGENKNNNVSTGGIVGWLSVGNGYNYIKNNYNIGEIELKTIVTTTTVGGIIGRAVTGRYEENDNYYLEGISKIKLNSISESKTVNEMKEEEFVNLLNNGASEKVWEIRDGTNDGYPVIVGLN